MDQRAFSAVIKDEKSARRSLTALFPEITEEGLEKMDHALEVQCAYGGAIYRASIKRVTIQSDSGPAFRCAGQKTEQQVLAVYLYDETEIHEYMQAITDQKMVAGLIYLITMTKRWRAWRRCAGRFWWPSSTGRSANIFPGSTAS